MVLRSTERCEMRRTMIRPFKMYLAVGRQAQSPVASSNSLQQGGAPLGSRACSPCPTGWLVGLDNNYIERSARQPVAVLWAFCGDRWALAARRRSPKLRVGCYIPHGPEPSLSAAIYPMGSEVNAATRWRRRTC